jgi:CheY-like chemotaxis protein
LHDYVDRTFRHVAESKKLDFEVDVAATLPRAIHTDAKRLQQILKNLLSNAFKFTERGGVTLTVLQATEGWNGENDNLNRARTVVAFAVKDSGIGIPSEKQAIIFEAFQQADGSTSRKYGGTGLGLAISRELAKLLGGEIKLTSLPGEGSTFTLYLPQSYSPSKSHRRSVTSTTVATAAPAEAITPLPELAPDARALPESQPAQQNLFADDTGDIRTGDKILLIVENEANFARILLEMAHENGFKALIAPRGATALAMALDLNPAAITLDINLPDIDGWRILNRLKDDPATRHIPVQLITTEEEAERGLRMGAMGALTKPIKTKESLDETFTKIKSFVDPRVHRVLLVQNEEERRQGTAEIIGGDDCEIVGVADASSALAALKSNTFDLAVVDFDLGSGKGFDLVDEIREEAGLRELPIILYSARDLSKKEEVHLKRLVQTMPLRDVRSPERLLDDVSLFLHRRVDHLPEEKRMQIEGLHRTENVLAGKKVLVVDDDIRNIFAMTSLLEPFKMQILSAETGKSAIETLQRTPDIDVVLMDIMMPDMDGYDTMRAIRKLAKFRALPIIALTAKAMKGDREKCIEAGASDYISKPVDTEQLLGLLRVWLFR